MSIHDVVAEHIKVEHFEQQLFCGCGFRLWHPGTGFGDPSTVQQAGQTVAEAALAWHLAKKIQEHLDAEPDLATRVHDRMRASFEADGLTIEGVRAALAAEGVEG